jgi:DNA-binding HxlR family transcriptional regulator
MSGYGQFCPVSKAMDVLDERWTLLVVRELLEGSRHFNDLRRGLPRMSPALLSKRLKTLTRAGVVAPVEADGRAGYALTECGRELAGVVDALGVWGVRWIGELGDDDLDPHLLMWDMQHKIPASRWPPGRTTVAIRLGDVAPRAARWWIVVADGHPDICDVDPGYEVAATVGTDLRTLTRPLLTCCRLDSTRGVRGEEWRGEEYRRMARRAGLRQRVIANRGYRRRRADRFQSSTTNPTAQNRLDAVK